MRVLWGVAVLIGSAMAAATPAFAAPLVIPNGNSAPYDVYAAQTVEQPWNGHRPEMQLQEQPIGELIATRLGLAEGSAELFRYQLENAPSTRTQLDGVIDGGGIKLKLTW